MCTKLSEANKRHNCVHFAIEDDEERGEHWHATYKLVVCLAGATLELHQARSDIYVIYL